MLLAPHPPYIFGVYLGGDIPFYSQGNWLNWSSKKKSWNIWFFWSLELSLLDICVGVSHRAVYMPGMKRRTTASDCCRCIAFGVHTTGAINMSDAGIYCQEAKKPFFVHYYYYYRGTRKVTPTMYTIQSNVASMYVVLFSFPNHRYDMRKYWLKTSLFQQFQN